MIKLYYPGLIEIDNKRKLAIRNTSSPIAIISYRTTLTIRKNPNDYSTNCPNSKNIENIINNIIESIKTVVPFIEDIINAICEEKNYKQIIIKILEQTYFLPENFKDSFEFPFYLERKDKKNQGYPSGLYLRVRENLNELILDYINVIGQYLYYLLIKNQGNNNENSNIYAFSFGIYLEKVYSNKTHINTDERFKRYNVSHEESLKLIKTFENDKEKDSESIIEFYNYLKSKNS